VFFENSLIDVATYPISIIGTTLSLENNNYTSDDDITMFFENMEGTALDWIALFKANDPSHENYLLRWARTGALKDGNTTILSNSNIPAGAYELRAFFQDTYDVEATIPVTIHESLLMTLNQESYQSNENITINYSNMEGNAEDWIAIYPAGSTNEWENVQRWYKLVPSQKKVQKQKGMWL
jgi:hypothetical protein